MRALESNMDFQKDRNKSDFFNNLVEKELDDILDCKTLFSDSITIRQNYVYQNEYETELGIYITNTSEKKIKVGSLPLTFKGDEKQVYHCNYIFNIIIEKNSTAFVEVVIRKKDFDFKGSNINKINIEVSKLNDIVIENYVHIDTKELIDNKYYSQTQDIRKFIKALDFISEGKLAIDCYNIDFVDDHLDIVLIFRNSSNEEIDLKSLPIVVSDQRNLLLCQKNYQLDNFKIKPKGVKIAIINIPQDEIVITDKEFSKYKVEFVN